ncbi:MAG: cadherin-like domain-containing protein, partial [Myxococcaceae bacterium]|nr:cadherin-like domain-containing protein [Myxococcaceae bacterium]
YTPAAGFSGTDSFTYRASDGAPSNVATVSLSVSGGHASLVDTLVADFAAGTPGAQTAVVAEGDGAVQLAAAAREDFLGSGLPPGWSSTSWGAGGAVVVGGGSATVDGASVGSVALYGPGRALEFVATFGGAPWQHVGFGQTLASASESWLLLSTIDTDSQLFARINNAGVSVDVPLPAGLVGSPHLFRIEWGASSVAFFVDGALVASRDVTLGADMRFIASDYFVGGASTSVDWVQVGPFFPSGVFLSRILDAGQSVTWDVLSWSATLPPGTGVTLEVRVGPTPVPDASWSAFTPVAQGASVAQSGRYLQYRALLSTTDSSVTPSLQEVRLGTPTAASSP